MKYMGSKSRFAKDILRIVLKDRQPEQWYIEPFAGGMNEKRSGAHKLIKMCFEGKVERVPIFNTPMDAMLKHAKTGGNQ